jgi:transcriptional regulator of heat shock response
MLRNQYIIFLLMVLLGSCSKKKEALPEEDSSTKEILNPDLKKQLRSINKWSSKTEKTVLKVLSTNDDISKLIAIKRISKWSWEKKSNLLKSHLKTENSPLIKKTIFNILWRDKDSSEETLDSLILLSFELLMDWDESVFSTVLAKLEKTITDKHHSNIRTTIENIKKERKPILFQLLCNRKISKLDATFIASHGDSLGSALSLCKDKVSKRVKAKFLK